MTTELIRCLERFSLAIRRLAAMVALALVAAEGLAEERPEIPGIGPIGTLQTVAANLQFTEGPAADAQGRLYFSDVTGNRIYRLGQGGQPEVFLDPSGRANGLDFDSAGRLIVAQMEGRIVRVDVETKEVTPIAETYEGVRFNAPNDLTVDSANGIYFTDARFRAPTPWPQKTEAVYYVTPERKITRIIDDVLAPNGVLLSPDEKRLYVVPSTQKEIFAYDVTSPGKLGPQRIFAALQQHGQFADVRPGGDGLAVDRQGNLFVTSALGLQVFDTAGKLLGILPIPEPPSNAAFGGREFRTLYVTARQSVYSWELRVPGKPPGVSP